MIIFQIIEREDGEKKYSTTTHIHTHRCIRQELVDGRKERDSDRYRTKKITIAHHSVYYYVQEPEIDFLHSRNQLINSCGGSEDAGQEYIHILLFIG